MATGPTNEVGGAPVGGAGVGGTWSILAQEVEHVPELQWPGSVRVYERMLTDSQVLSLYLGTALPLLDYVWWIEPGDANADAAERFAQDVGLPLGEPADDYEPVHQPGLYRFNFREHLSEALLALAYGHYYFEQVGTVEGGWWRLRKLGPRAPQTIAEWDVAPDGGLRAIRQNGVVTSERRGVIMVGQVPPIPIDRLVAYVWMGDSRTRWTGRSMFRSLYRHWIVKDRLIRVDAINHERAGGVPVVETDHTFQGQSLDSLAAVAQDFRVGEDGGGALPPGAKLSLVRAGGTDVIASINYHDDSMARVWSSQVRQLAQGGDSANRAVGDTFAGLEDMARRSVASWFRGIFREHVIEDWFAWNLGEGAAVPVLACRPREQAAPAARQPAAPPPPQEPGGAPGGDPTQAAAEPPSPRAPVAAAAAIRASRLPDRPLRRQLTDAEVRAGVDWAQMDVAYDVAVSQVQDWWMRAVVPAQVAGVADQIVLTRQGTQRQRVTRTAMARIAAPELGADTLRELLLPVMRDAARAAQAEALAQGIALAVPTDEQLLAALADLPESVAAQGANGMSLAAQRKATQLVGGGRTPAEVAQEVADHLAGMKHQWTRDQLQGAVQAATNAGRFRTWEAVPGEAPVRYHSSELLDVNTCGPCAAIDGREYPTLQDAQRDYPTGGFNACEGGPRCRGTVVAVFDEN